MPIGLTSFILDAYCEGTFPMAEDADDDDFAFYKPKLRGLLPIAGLHIPKRLRATLRKRDYMVTLNQDFAGVIDGCADATETRKKTWINRPIRDIFIALHQEGHAHSVECRDLDGTLIGGIYGLAIGRVFCGESMFSRKTDASKIALVNLTALLWKQGFTVFDTQFINPHLMQFGAYEIPQEAYETLIATEIKNPVAIPALTREDFAILLKHYLFERHQAEDGDTT